MIFGLNTLTTRQNELSFSDYKKCTLLIGVLYAFLQYCIHVIFVAPVIRDMLQWSIPIFHSHCWYAMHINIESFVGPNFCV